ncbi:MAG: hypothetical protein AAFN30_02510 [Actinomycetota bacterium]
MTRQESFKKRIRARMADTGERYLAARQVLLAQAEERRRPWVSAPEVGSDAVRAATGRGWDDWVDLIEAWPGAAEGHTAIAAHLESAHDVDGWWAQTITVGFERITGRRLPYQRPDGTFTAGKSKTVVVDAAALRSALLDDAARRDLFPGHGAELRSDPTAKALRIAIGPGVAQFAIDDRGDGRAKVTVAHERLPSFEEVEAWKFYWSEWLDAVDGASSAAG